MAVYPTRGVVQRLAVDIAEGRVDVGPAVDKALHLSDTDRASALLLAEAVRGRPLDASRVAALLPDLSDIGLFPVFVGACGGDRVAMLLDLVEANRMSSERDALALFLAAELLADALPPPRLAAQLRIQARRGLGLEASILLAMAAKTLGDPDVLEVAKTWLPMARVAEAKPLRERVMHQLSAPVLSVLPEKAPVRAVSGFTVRRPAPRVGRNDPCPCGSGKKYKKCCAEKDAERASDPSPLPGMTRTEYLRSAGPHLTERDIEGLRPFELAEVDLATLRTLPLIVAVRRASAFHRWDLAERGMAVLASRSDSPDGDGEGYRADLIAEAVEAGNTEVAERQIALMPDPTSVDPSDLLAIELRRPTAETLAHIEQQALVGLREPDGATLIELSHALLKASPALGILVARASLSARRSLDSEMLGEVIEEARDRLALRPGDPIRELYELMLDRDARDRAAVLMRRGENAERDRLVAEADALAVKLEESKHRIATLERGLRTQRASLDRLPPEQARIPQTLAVTAAAPAPSEADELDRRRLRAKVDELKQLLTERNLERSSLRKQLAKVNDAMVADAPDAERDSEAEQAESEDEAGVETPRGVLVPRFEASWAGEVRGVPPAVARKGLMTVASLAGGDATAWRQVKRMTSVTGQLFSCRVGIHHRVLFRLDEGELTPVSLVHRKDLEPALRRHGRTPSPHGRILPRS